MTSMMPTGLLDRAANIGHCCAVAVLWAYGPERRGNPVARPELSPQL